MNILLSKTVLMYIFGLFMSNDWALKCLESKIVKKGIINAPQLDYCFWSEDAEIDRIEANIQLFYLLTKYKDNYPTSLEDDLKIYSKMYGIIDNIDDIVIDYSNRTNSQDIIMQNILLYRINQKNIIENMILTTVHQNTYHNTSLFISYYYDKVKLTMFNEWFYHQNISQNTKEMIESDLFPNYRYGLKIKRKIRKNETFLSMSDDIILNRKSAHTNLTILFPLLKEKIGYNDEYMNIILLFLYENYLGEYSYWYAYISILPKLTELNYPILYNDTYLVELYGSDLQEYISLYQLDLKQKCEKYKRILSNYTNIYPIEVLDDYDTFVWSNTLVNSRSVYLNDIYNFIPMYDLINWSNKRREEKEDNIKNIIWNEETHLIQFIFNGEIVNNQLLIYDNQPSYIHFIYHGFISEIPIENDCVYISLRLNQYDKNYIMKIKQLQKYKIYNTHFHFCLNSNIFINNFRLIYSILNEIDLNDNDKYIKSVYKYIGDKLNTYTTSIETDEKLLKYFI